MTESGSLGPVFALDVVHDSPFVPGEQGLGMTNPTPLPERVGANAKMCSGPSCRNNVVVPFVCPASLQRKRRAGHPAGPSAGYPLRWPIGQSRGCLRCSRRAFLGAGNSRRRMPPWLRLNRTPRCSAAENRDLHPRVGGVRVMPNPGGPIEWLVNHKGWESNQGSAQGRLIRKAMCNILRSRCIGKE